MSAPLRIILPVLIFSVFTRPAGAQNLVVNPSFEDTMALGTCDYLLECYAKNWADYVTTADHFYIRSQQDSINLARYFRPMPRTGNGMAGGYVYGTFSGGHNREFLQGNLSQPLKAGKQYRLEAWVSPHLQSPVIVSSISTLGFAVTDSHYKNPRYAMEFLIPETPEVVNGAGTPVEPQKWTKVTGCFTAKGGETKIIVGNFMPDSLSGQRIIPGAADSNRFGDLGYYHFDDLLLEEVLPPAVSNDTVVCRGISVSFSTPYVEGATYAWNTGEVTPEITAPKPGSYTVTVVTPPGCTSSATARLAWIGCGEPCPEPFLPTAFSPNGDGKNDVLRVVNEPYMDFGSLAIFNRWGQKLFHTYKGGTAWDGRFGSADCEQGTYMYLLRYEDCMTEEELKTE